MAVGFGDEMRVGLRGMVRRVWGRRGTKVRQRVQLAYKYKYLFLAVDGQTGRLHWCWLDSMKGDEVVLAAGGLFAETPIEVLVWDGAGSHKDARVYEFGRPVITLPPYSPELNPAERVFEELRAAIEGKPYTTLDDKIAAVETELAKYDADPAKVRSLANWHWIEAALPQPALDIAA
jgi:hypothetical protein